MGLEPPSLAPWIRPCGESQKGTGVKVAGVDPGFSKGGANGNAWPHGCGKGEGAMEAFAMCA